MFVFKLSQVLWLFAILSISNVAVAQGASSDKLDLVGIRLGMTEAEVAGAIKAFDPAAKQTSRRMAHYPYSDGVSGFQTPAFLDEIVY